MRSDARDDHDHDCHEAGCTYPDGTRVVAGDSLQFNPQGATLEPSP